MAIIFKGNQVAGVGKPGRTGESAYEIALKNGYEGSEEQFAQELNDAVNVKNYLEEHNVSETAHQDIRDLIDDVETSIEEELTKKSDVGHDHNDMYYTEAEIDDKFASIPTPDVSGQINTHNTDTLAHKDIRDAILQRTQVQIITWGADD